ncbi:MAG: hypothetical protein KGO93_01020 [Cyanobacteria bacterium REEB446]|nr:hypothetical protein [Cyanobacteria bacterium REEB446]
MVTKVTKKPDGGYYAIKGFAYQIDKAMLELLDTKKSEAEIFIENIQDIDSESFVMQIKYKETQKFSNSKIKEPVIQLIDEFLNNKNESKKYYLYCFFKDRNATDTGSLSLEELNKILGKKSNQYEDEDKNSFLENFKLDFSPSFQEQFDKVIEKINSTFGSSNQKEAMFYYSQIDYQIRKIILNNPNPQSRKCNKKEIIEIVKRNKEIIFNSSFQEYLGKEAYFKFIASKCQSPNKQQENCFLFGHIEDSKGLSIQSLLEELVIYYFTKANYEIKPLVFIFQDKEKANTVKKHFIRKELFFNDGYESIEFNHKAFSRKALTKRKMLKNEKPSDTLQDISFKARIISLESIQGTSDFNYTPDRLYLFDCDIDKVSPQSLLKGNITNTEGLSTLDIQKLFISKKGV